MNIKNKKPQYRHSHPFRVDVLNIKHYSAHYHDDFEMIYCLSGKVSIRTSNRNVMLSADDTLSIDPGDIHCLYSDTDNVTMILNLDLDKLALPEFVPDNCFFSCETQNCMPFQVEAMKKIKKILLSTAYSMLSEQSMPDSYYMDMADMLMKYMVKYFDWLSFIPDPYFENKPFNNRLHDIMKYCFENCSEKITARDIAARENINRNYLSQFMKKTGFNGFKSMITYFRCYHAERLLLTTDKTATEISHMVGFSNPKYFYQNFRKWWNITPIQLRLWYRSFQEQKEIFSELPPQISTDLLKDKIVAEYIRI